MQAEWPCLKITAIKKNQKKKPAVKRTCFKDPNDKALQETQMNVKCWEATTSNQTGNRSCLSKCVAWTTRKKGRAVQGCGVATVLELGRCPE